MTRGLLFAGAVSLLLGGCASSSDTERRAETHDYRAQQAASVGAYDTAAAEKHEADRLHDRAARQRAEESYDATVPPPPPPGDSITPAPIPPPPAGSIP